MTDNSYRLRWVQVVSVCLLCLLVGAGVFFDGRKFAGGVLLGGLVSLLSFQVLIRVVVRTIRGGRGGLLALQVAFKFLFLGGTVLLALVWFDTDPYGLTLGMSVVFISICLAGLAELRLLTAANTESTDA